MPRTAQFQDVAEQRGAEPRSAEASMTPEADRLFDPPSPVKAARILRELDWGEHFVAANMAFARGAVESYFYSLGDAAAFFNDSFSVSISIGSGGSYKVIKLDKFVTWIRDVIGDDELAMMLGEQLAAKTAYNDQIEELSFLVTMRAAQCEACLGSNG